MCWINIQSSQPRSCCCNYPHFVWDFEWFCNRCTHFWHINRFHIQIHWFVTGNNFNHHLFPSMDSRPSFPHLGLPTPSASLGPIWDMCAWNRWHWAILILGLSDMIAMSLEIYGTPKAGQFEKVWMVAIEIHPTFQTGVTAKSFHEQSMFHPKMSQGIEQICRSSWSSFLCKQSDHVQTTRRLWRVWDGGGALGS